MAQSITLQIAGVNYPFNAPTPEAERLMRLAADDVNAMLEKYNAKFPDRPKEDKMAFVTLQQTIGRLSAKSELAAMKARVDALEAELASYLSGIEK